jgi:glutamate-1-semialdehyde 2,1-aminomutase
MRNGLGEIIERNGYPCMVAGFGSVYTVYFMSQRLVENYDVLLDNDAGLYVRYRQELMRRGVFEIPMNLKRNHLSYSHTEADVDLSLEVAEAALRATFDARAAKSV